MRCGILGGSFDPVHRGHLAVADHLLGRELADRLIVIPAWLSPFKCGNSAPPAARLAMVRLAFADKEKIAVDDREIVRGGMSFTVATLEELATEFPDERLRLVIGADNLAGFASWRRPDRIQELAEIVVYPRDGLEPTAAALARSGLDPDRVIRVTDFDHPVSSTTVRAMLSEGICPSDLLPGPVATYISRHRLYSR
jgi:nicotinate-nucleotide adenylyltransferase